MVILTGAAGFLGSFVLYELIRQGFEVTALYHRLRPTDPFDPRLHWVYADLSRPETLNKLPCSEDGIIHLACSLSTIEQEVLRCDLRGMQALLKKWEQGAFIYCSSTDVYGPLGVIPASEDHPLDPPSWYGLGKLACENMLVEESKKRGPAQSVIFRPPYILGWRPTFSGSLVGKLVTHALLGHDFILPASGTGQPGHSWIEARELASWMVAALKGGPSGVYNVVSGYVSWKELVDQIIKISGSPSKVGFATKGSLPVGLCSDERRFAGEKFCRAFHRKKFADLGLVLGEIVTQMRSIPEIY
jgi:nucleoside-diphosphate-sugar epimerase